MTIMVSTAYLDEGEKCDRLGLMHRARLLDSATPAEIRSQFETLEEAMIERIQDGWDKVNDHLQTHDDPSNG